MRQAQSQDGQCRKSVKVSLEEMFQIMCSQEAFDSPVVLCAAYIALLKTHIASPELVKCFGTEISKLDPVAYDLVLQELLNTARQEVTVIEACLIALDSAPQGASFFIRLMIGKDIPFTISKLLFELTRHFLTTATSEIFIGLLKLILKILREQVINL